MTDPTAQVESALALWLSSVAVALTLVLAAFACHAYRDVRARVKLLEQKVALPKLQKQADELAGSVEQSALAAEAVINGGVGPPPAGTPAADVPGGHH